MIAKIIEFDIDGILTVETEFDPEDPPGTYIYRSPNIPNIDLLKKAHSLGWTVVLHTGRREEQRRITESWLSQHKIPYHFLFMGKPLCKYRIDDVNITPDDFNKLLENECEKEK